MDSYGEEASTCLTIDIKVTKNEETKLDMKMPKHISLRQYNLSVPYNSTIFIVKDQNYFFRFNSSTICIITTWNISLIYFNIYLPWTSLYIFLNSLFHNNEYWFHRKIITKMILYRRSKEGYYKHDYVFECQLSNNIVRLKVSILYDRRYIFRFIIIV